MAALAAWWFLGQGIKPATVPGLVLIIVGVTVVVTSGGVEQATAQRGRHRRTGIPPYRPTPPPHPSPRPHRSTGRSLPDLRATVMAAGDWQSIMVAAQGTRDSYRAAGRPVYVPFLADGQLDPWRENGKKFYLTDRNRTRTGATRPCCGPTTK